MCENDMKPLLALWSHVGPLTYNADNLNNFKVNFLHASGLIPEQGRTQGGGGWG